MKHAHEYEINIRFYLEKINTAQLSEKFSALQLWQSQRLLNTHLFLYEDPRFQPAMNFFKDELYNAEHFIKRNEQINRALPMMCRTMPNSILNVIEKAAHLHGLSFELDHLLLHYLPVDQDIKQLTLDDWIEAYKRSGGREQRVLQIDLIEELGNELARVVKKPMIHKLLKWAKLPAKFAGYEDIHEFACIGFDAFSTLDDAQEFLQPVVTTERRLLKEWFGDAS